MGIAFKQRLQSMVLKARVSKKTFEPSPRSAYMQIGQHGRHIPFLAYSVLSSFDRVFISEESHASLFAWALRVKNMFGTEVYRSSEIEDFDVIQFGDKRLPVTYDYYAVADQMFYLPFYEHPDFYRRLRNTDTTRIHDAIAFREHRIGFAGSGLIEPYETQYRFPTLNRNQVLRRVIESANASEASNASFSLHITNASSNTVLKHQMNSDEYNRFLSRCDFFVCPPGLRIPHSHNYVEALRNGAIPIINYNDSVHPPLTHGESALVFSTENDLADVLDYALGLSASKIFEMRTEVSDYYREYLDPDQFWVRCMNDLSAAARIAIPVSVRSPDFIEPTSA